MRMSNTYNGDVRDCVFIGPSCNSRTEYCYSSNSIQFSRGTRNSCMV